MMGWFKRKMKEPVAPKMVKVGKGIVIIKVQSGKEYTKTLVGGAFKYSTFSGIWLRSAESMYRNLVNSENLFITEDGGLAIPVCNIENMRLAELDPDYEVEVK